MPLKKKTARTKTASAASRTASKPKVDPVFVEAFGIILRQIESNVVLNEGNAGKLARQVVRMKRDSVPMKKIYPYFKPFIREIAKFVDTSNDECKRSKDGNFVLHFNITDEDLKGLGLP
jgi:hypothetical protein